MILINKTMEITLWALSFILLTVGATVGVGASIGALEPEWFVLCLCCIAGVFSAAEIADKYNIKG